MPDSMPLRLRGRPSARYSPQAKLTGRQIRAARVLLGWNTTRLADESEIGIATVHRAEASKGVPSVQMHTLDTIQATLERAGIVFLDADETGGLGLRLTGG